MFRFANPLWLLLAIPVLGLAALLWWRSRRPLGLRFPDLDAVEKAAPRVRVGPDEAVGLLVVIGLLCAVVAMARPQSGLVTEQISGRGVDIMLCLDTSGSMRSEDFKPQNRLGAAKEVARQFIQARPRDRLGLVVFGVYAVTACPLTSDKGALLEYLKQVRIGMAGEERTAVGMALATAADRLRSSKAASKVILLLTDGSNNSGEVDPLTAAKAAAALGIKVYAVGAGSPEGGMMPVTDPIFGTRYVRMENDLDEASLKSVAAATEGVYFRAKNTRGLQEIFAKINDMEKSEYKVAQFTNYEDHYYGWLIAAFALVLLATGLRQTVFRRIP